MKKLLALILIFSMFGFWNRPAYAVWTYTQNFDGLNTGDLTGQDSWSGSVSFDVQTTTVLEGTKSVGNTAGGGGVIDRTITSFTTGDVQFRYQKSSNAANTDFRVKFLEGTTIRYTVGWADGAMRLSGATTPSLEDNPLTNTNYCVQVVFNQPANTAKARLSTDCSTWGAYTADVNPSGANWLAIDAIRLTNDTATFSTFYDDFKDVTPVVAGELIIDEWWWLIFF